MPLLQALSQQTLALARSYAARGVRADALRQQYAHLRTSPSAAMSSASPKLMRRRRQRQRQHQSRKAPRAQKAQKAAPPQQMPLQPQTQHQVDVASKFPVLASDFEPVLSLSQLELKDDEGGADNGISALDHVDVKMTPVRAFAPSRRVSRSIPPQWRTKMTKMRNTVRTMMRSKVLSQSTLEEN